MNVQITAPKEFEESSAIIGVPKVRNLLPSKKYRENVKKWGESSEVKRRRVIVVPSIKCAARDITLANEGQGKRIISRDSP